MTEERATDIDLAHGDVVRATMYDGQVSLTGKVITVDRVRGLALVLVQKVGKTTWPYPPKVGETPRVAIHNCEVVAEETHR